MLCESFETDLGKSQEISRKILGNLEKILKSPEKVRRKFSESLGIVWKSLEEVLRNLNPFVEPGCQ